MLIPFEYENANILIFERGLSIGTKQKKCKWSQY